jgi:hypothetical protein
MVDVTTTVTDNGLLKLWTVPPLQQREWSPVPMGEVLFEGTQSLPSKLAADQNRLALTMNLPRNNVYRLMEARAWIQGVSVATIGDWEPAMNVLVDPNLVGSTGPGTWEFGLYDQTKLFESVVAYAFAFTAVTNHFTAEYLKSPGTPIDSPFQAANDGRIFLRWMDITGNTTGGIIFNWRFRCLMYSQEQYDKFPMNSPVPTL